MWRLKALCRTVIDIFKNVIPILCRCISDHFHYQYTFIILHGYIDKWETVSLDKGDFDTSKLDIGLESPDPKILFNEILDNTLTNLQARFDFLNKFEVLSFIDPNKYSNYIIDK